MISNRVFKRQINTEQELRDLLGYPSELVMNKAIQKLDEHCRRFIAKSPFLCMSTSDASGACDVSPRGDTAGFVHILDDQHLVIPERPGNRRLDSIRNILANPYIGIIFMIPGLEETLRINGKACIVQDDDLLEQMKARGKKPMLGIGVQVEECYIHCAKAFKRSALWEPSSWLTSEERPHIPSILASHANMKGITSKEVELSLKDTYENRLY